MLYILWGTSNTQYKLMSKVALHARPLPAFQCCTLKRGPGIRSHMINVIVTYYIVKRSPRKASDSRLHIHYSHSVCILLKLKRIVLQLLVSNNSLTFRPLWTGALWNVLNFGSPMLNFHPLTTLHTVMSVTWLVIPCLPAFQHMYNIEKLGVGWHARLA